MKKLSLFIFALGLLLNAPYWSQAQTIIEFNNVDGGGYALSYSEGGFSFSINDPNNGRVISSQLNGGYNNSKSLWDNNPDPNAINRWTIKKVDGSAFKFIGIYLRDPGRGGSTSGTITAYKSGVKVGTSVSTAFNGTYNQSFATNADFSDVDEIRIEAPDINFFLDHFTYAEVNNQAITPGDPTNFVTTWKTDNNGPTDDNQILIPATGEFNYLWENMANTAETGSGSGSGPTTITFPQAGTYRLNIKPTGSTPFHQVQFYQVGSDDKNKILTVNNWGTIPWSGFKFNGCSNLKITATDIPDLRGVTNLEFAFSHSGIESIPNVNEWNMKTVTNLSNFFEDVSGFNQSLSKWDVSNVTDMSFMFDGATSFNQPLDSWDVSKLTIFDYMFRDATSFNQSLAAWNLENFIGSIGALINSGMSCENYSYTLYGWANNPNTNANATFNPYGSTEYSPVIVPYRDFLINNLNWNISGDALGTCSIILPGPPITPGIGNTLYVDINVNTTVASYTDTGDSWANAIPELANALKWAREQYDGGSPGWTQTNPLRVFVAKGTYLPLYSAADGQYTTDGSRDNSFVLVADVKLYGGFDPANGIVTLENPRILPDRNGLGKGSVLSGDFLGNDNNNDFTNHMENAYHVVIGSGDVGTAGVDGFEVTGGNADGIGPLTVNGQDFRRENGGGMYNYFSSPTLIRMSIRNSSAKWGGGMYINESAPILNHVSIRSNRANTWGGGIYSIQSSPKLINVGIYNNTANDRGSGILHGSGIMEITNSTIVGNTPNTFDQSGVLKLNNTIVWGDTGELRVAYTNSLIEGSTNTDNGNIDSRGLTAADIFVNPDIGDYTLKANSPAINAGNNTAYTDAGGNLTDDLDLDGNLRLYKGIPDPDRIDIGAYEFQGELNTTPVAVDDEIAVTEDTPATGNALTNDSDAEGDALTAYLVTAPVNGTIVLNADGSFTYTPNANYNGMDSLTYQVCDNGTPSLCDTALVHFNVKGINPKVINVNSVSLDGTYKIADIITLTVSFDKAVLVDVTGGSPTLLLETGSTDRKAAYISGSGSSTLTFNYTVQAGDFSADLDYASNTALTLNGATIKNTIGEDAVITLPTVGGAGSIAGQHGVMVDGIAPTIPANFAATAGNAENSLTWDANTETDLDSYKIYAGTANEPTTLLTTIPSPGITYLHHTLINGTTYYYRISAVDHAGNESPVSPSIFAKPMASQVITFDQPATKTYGQEPFDLSGSSDAGLPLTYTSSDPTIASINGKMVTILKAGTVQITATQSGNEAIKPATSVARSLDIIQKTITVNVTAKSKAYGAADPELSYTFNPELEGTDKFTGSLGRAPGETIGSYPINQGTLALNSNYTLNFISTNLVIGKTILTISAENKEKFVGTVNPPLTVKYAGFAFNETPEVLITEPSISTSATTSSPAGDYPILVSGAAAANYELNYVNGILKVKQGAPTDITMESTIVYENGPAKTKAGAFNSISGDPSTTYTYSLVSGTGDTDNALFSIEDNSIFTKNALDFENKAMYSIRIKTTTQYGLSLEKAFKITITDVNEAPTLASISNSTICYTTASQTIPLTGISAGPEINQTVTLSVNSDNPTLFQNLKVTGSENNASLNYSITEGKIGTANITVTVTDDGGIANGGINTYSKTFVLTINPLPLITIISDKGSAISKGDVVQLTASGATSYVWTANNIIISGQNTAILTVRPIENTTYAVVGTNTTGCFEKQSFYIKVVEDFKLIANNIVTPNGDGYNDKWIVENIDIYSDNLVKIFDRAGRLLYSKKGYDNSWDATYNGNPLNEDTYYYIMEFMGNTRKFKGYITVVRQN